MPGRSSSGADPIMTWTLSRPGRVLLAALSAGAGVIHLVMVRSHASEWPPEGYAFGLVGALQLAIAVQLLWRPSQLALRLACLANAAFVGVWVLSRIWGLPVGPESGHPHDASFVDVTCVLLEAAFVLVGYELLARPDRGARLRAPSLAGLALLPIGVVAVTIAAVTSPSVAEHAHGEHDHSGETAAGHGHGDESGHDHADAEVAFLFPDGADGGWSEVQNGEEHGPHRAQVPIEELAPRTRRELQRQLALTLVPVMAYPTVADAEAAGYHRTGSFNPGLGVHYTGGMSDMDGALSDEEITHPSTITYDGTDPDSPIVGFMYNSTTYGADREPAGFAGPNDQWHSHSGICIKFRDDGEMDVLGADDGVDDQEECEARGAQFLGEIQTSLLHVWTVPAYTNPLGVFAHANPALPCEDGTYVTTHACQVR